MQGRAVSETIARIIRTLGRVALLPLIILPLWLAGISTFSTIGVLPAGTAVLALLSIMIAYRYQRLIAVSSLEADILNKLIVYFWIIFSVSFIFFIIQITIWMWADRYSTTLHEMMVLYNKISAKIILTK
jgi:hypothetical protein